MKKKIVLMLVLAAVALLVLCAFAFAEPNCSNCVYGEWAMFDQDQHYRFCTVCGDVQYGNHTGGTATCLYSAVCDVCNESYGDSDTTNHGQFSNWAMADNKQHYRWCNDCARPETYQYENHTGGTATCRTLAVCDVCDQEYGDYSTTNHGEFGDWTVYDLAQHVRYCIDCGQNVQYQKHTGGMATCIEMAVCEVCNSIYGGVNTTNHGEFTNWIPYDDNQHFRRCSDCHLPATYQFEDHTGAPATCSQLAVCEVCQYIYQWFDEDNHNFQMTRIEGTETHKTVCLYSCGYDEIEDCFGGKATCVSPAVCAGCGETYGEADSVNGHEYNKKVVEGTCTTKGYIEYTCKYCGDSYTEPAKTANLHWFDLWTSNGDGTHSAPCKREGCDHISNNKCEFYEVTIGENTYSVCPVCGDGVFEIVEGALIEGENLPIGEAIVRGFANPFEGVLYAFTAGYEYSGDMEAFTEAVKVSLPVSVEGEFKLMLASEAALTEIAYTVEEGILSFETESAGLYLIVPVVEEVEEAA